MGFFAEAWYGICQELSVYRKSPQIFCSKMSSLLIMTVFQIVFNRVLDENLVAASSLNAMFQIQYFLSPARAVLQKMAAEREENFKEYLMVNGMTKSAYQAKVAVSNYLEVLFTAITQGCVFYYSYHKYFPSPLTLAWSILILFIGGTGVINMALYLSTVFSPKTGPAVGPAIVTLLGYLYFAALWKMKLKLYLYISIYPIAGIPLALNNLLPAETKIEWDGFKTWMALSVLSCTSLFFLILYLFKERDQDQDLVKKKKKKSVRPLKDVVIHRQIIEEKANLELPLINYDYHFENIHLNNNFKTVIEAIDLKKVYPECTAVNGMNFAIYEKEIFCLLGHNGAGKSTLVNMLTGLIPKTEGTFLYDGEEVYSNLNKIRGLIGFCPQKDYLLMENTVLDNLKFFAKIKKISDSRIDAEIERVINKLGLATFKDMPAKKLSGGFKRKLNIGVALLNDPKIIIMDEPTSGMDPVSRRSFWEIIKGLKTEGKTVVLTTQFLDEAEELSDRIAIMSKGKLFACGTADYIKKKFGSGYKLIIQNKNSSSNEETERFKNQVSDEIKAKVNSIIPSAVSESEVSNNCLEFSLPFNEQSRFSQLFQELEQIPNLQISLQMVSLEEAFVSLGINHEKFENDDDQKHSNQTHSLTPPLPPSFLKEKIPTFMDQLVAVFLEKWYKFKTNKATLFFAMFPLIFILGSIVFAKFTEDKKAAVGSVVSLTLSGNAFLLHVFISPPAKDRISKITPTLRAMGLQSLPYWLGTLVADMILVTFNTLLLIGCIHFLNFSLLKDHLVNFGLLYLAFSFHLLTFAYNWSLIGQKVEQTVGLTSFLFYAGFLLSVLLAKGIEWLIKISVLKYFFVLSMIFLGPATTLALGIYHLVPSEYVDEKFIKFAPLEAPWMYTILAFIMGILDFVKLLRNDKKFYDLIEKKIYKERKSHCRRSLMKEDEGLDDIEFEKNRLNSQNNNDLIKAIEVQKVYPNGFKALSDLTFGVESGQVFCLLGPNGAGKTTAFEIMTAAIPKTSGKVFLENKALSREIEAFYRTGICSQSNTLWDHVTVEQHLKIYARLKGLRGAEIDQAIKFLLKALQFEEHAKKGSEKLSGGNKRKLCVALAMIGAPKLLFLDEPSTGMDPVARRHLWGLIKEVMKGRQGAMVLTTHYLQEAELVADKLGILINGKFATLGDLPRLKQKFGEYSVVVYQPGLGIEQEIDKIMTKNFPDSKRQDDSPEEENNGNLTYKVPLESMKFSNVFTELENFKSQRKIKDFTISTSTLEQIFINFAKHQIKKEDDL